MAITSYINLARKYRPQSVKDLIGQEALVTTLQNAFSLNRIAHAFMLTGVRGVGKTTTARIIAKALNCIGTDGKGDITLNPCGVCENCLSITEDRHMDIIEMDAASRTGVDDVRAIIENAKYNPVSARYKVFIIDEVHMLSKNAFNALLKTLEEPPPRLKFIFATTEIRKVPITVLSRCQRFDLQRITIEDLTNNLANICKQENINYNEAGLFLLAKAANGSARDSLSLLDQAIVYADIINAENVAKMLGQGSIEEVYNLFAAIINNQENTSFKFLEQQYNKGIELSLLFEDLLEICHNVTMCKVLGKAPFSLSEFEATTSKTIAESTSLPTLIKIWQVLLKGLEELQKAIIPINTARMIMAKLTLVNALGDVDKIINFLNKNPELNNSANVNIPELSNVATATSNQVPPSSTSNSSGSNNSNNSQPQTLSSNTVSQPHSNQVNNPTNTKPSPSNPTTNINTKPSMPSTDTNNLSARDEIFIKKDYNAPVSNISPNLTSSISAIEPNVPNQTTSFFQGAKESNLQATTLLNSTLTSGIGTPASASTSMGNASLTDLENSNASYTSSATAVTDRSITAVNSPHVAQSLVEDNNNLAQNYPAYTVTNPVTQPVAESNQHLTNPKLNSTVANTASTQELSVTPSSQSMSESEITAKVTTIFPNAKKVD